MNLEAYPIKRFNSTQNKFRECFHILRQYGDFILDAEAKLEGELHTGFLFRCVDAKADTSKVSLYGYQVKIDPTPRQKPIQI